MHCQQPEPGDIKIAPPVPVREPPHGKSTSAIITGNERNNHRCKSPDGSFDRVSGRRLIRPDQLIDPWIDREYRTTSWPPFKLSLVHSKAHVAESKLIMRGGNTWLRCSKTNGRRWMRNLDLARPDQPSRRISSRSFFFSTVRPAARSSLYRLCSRYFCTWLLNRFGCSALYRVCGLLCR